MSASRRVVVTGIGLVSSLGDSSTDLHESLCAGRSGLRQADDWAAEGLSEVTVGDLPDFDPVAYLGRANFRPLDRTSLLAASAAALALSDAGWTEESRSNTEMGLVLGTMFGSIHTISEFDRRALTAGPNYVKPMEFANSVINAAAGQTAIWHGLRGLNATISGGSASGVQALGYAADLIRNERASVLLAGGVDETCFESLLGFSRAGLLCGPDNGDRPRPIPFDADRNGFAAAEGAALLVLEEAAVAEARDRPWLAEIVGCGNSYDRSRGADPQETAAAIERAAAGALEEAGLKPSDLDCVAVSASGSPEADRSEARGLASLFGEAWPKLPICAVKSALGEALGASGPFQTVALLEALSTGRLPGIQGLETIEEGLGLMATSQTRGIQGRRGLVHACAFDGTTSALVLGLPEASGS